MEKKAALEGSVGRESYDAVVVGSGYGGSVAACRLAMAGVRVCLLEKGRKWEAQDFPTDSFGMLSAVRMENQNLGISCGPKDALFQVNLSSCSSTFLASTYLLQYSASYLVSFHNT